MNTFEDVIKFAIDSEHKAVEFYRHLLTLDQAVGMKSFFEDLVKQEQAHAAKLTRILEQHGISGGKTTRPDYGLTLTDYLVESEHDESNINYQDALILAMKREKAAASLYQVLVDNTEDEELKKVFQFILEEEKSHQASFESEYDKKIQPDN